MQGRRDRYPLRRLAGGRLGIATMVAYGNNAQAPEVAVGARIEAPIALGDAEATFMPRNAAQHERHRVRCAERH